MRVVLTGVVVLMLATAAFFKIIYPVPVFKTFYLGVSLFELGVAALLLCFSNKWQAWNCLFLIFFAWGGYSLYTTIMGLPCSCMGAALSLPRGLSFSINMGMVIGSWCVLKNFGKAHLRFILLGLLAGLCGFISASIVYKYFNL